MKKQVTLFLILAVLVSILLPVNAAAAEEAPEFRFELQVDGKDTREAKNGDIITVSLWLHRTDAQERYTMYGMQSEIRYDSNFFELVEGSQILAEGISSNDIAKVDNYREMYMNYLSMNGGTTWEADTFVGSFQLRILAESGVTEITNQDFLVSVRDGSGSYPCQAADATVILSTDCTVSFSSNGGTEVPDQQVIFGETVQKPEDPSREGYSFDGWYSDIHLQNKWDFETDTVRGNMTLYAKWHQGSETAESPNSGDGLGIWMIPLCILLLLIILLVCAYVIKKKRPSKKGKFSR